MAGKKGQYQKKKVRQEQVRNVFSTITLLFLGFILVWSIVNNSIAIRQIRRNTLKEYTGTYSYELKRTYGKHRHYYYLITLDNGDVVSVPKSRLENTQIFDENPSLTFQYSDQVRRVLFSSAYSVLSMESVDSHMTLVDIETTLRGCVSSIWIYAILLFFWASLPIGWLILYYFAEIYRKRANKRKLKKTNPNQT